MLGRTSQSPARSSLWCTRTAESCSSTQRVDGCSLGCPAEPPPSFDREAWSSKVSRPIESRHKEAEHGLSCGGLRNFGCDHAAFEPQSRGLANGARLLLSGRLSHKLAALESTQRDHDEPRTPSASRHVDVSAAGDVASGLEDSTTTGRGLELVRQPREKARERPLVAIGSARIRSRAGSPPGANAEPPA